ncbi:MAG: hypothetical protein ABJA79_10595 [Parafilimonas sp.]
MLTKKQVLSVVKEMPDTFDTTYLFDKILLLKKIEQGMRELLEGKGVSTEQARKKLKKWLK